jgi:hypothetical protein
MIRRSDLMLAIAIAVAGSGKAWENSAKSHPKCITAVDNAMTAA